jgi:hypothetical protein
MAKPDLTYIDGGLFVTFFPETDAGEEAWAEMLRHDPAARFLSIHLPSIKAQLKAGGYTVQKARPRKPLTADELDALLGELA